MSETSGEVSSNESKLNSIYTQYKLLSDHKIYESQLKATFFSSFLLLNGILVGIVSLSTAIGFRLFTTFIALFYTWVLWMLLISSAKYIELRDKQLNDIEELLKGKVDGFSPIFNIRPTADRLIQGGISTMVLVRSIPFVTFVLWLLTFIFFMVTGTSILDFFRS